MNTATKDFSDLLLSSYLFIETYPLDKYKQALRENFNVLDDREKSIQFNSNIITLERFAPAKFEKKEFKTIIRSDFKKQTIRHTIQFEREDEAYYYLQVGILQYLDGFIKIENEMDDLYKDSREAYYTSQECKIRVEAVGNLVVITHILTT